jgi:uncharacterized protein (TIGR00296 family)
MYALTDEEGMRALAIARQALASALNGEQYGARDLPPVFQEKRGVFVTLKRKGTLRGCIGIPYPVMPLGEALIDAAVCSGLNDPRFPPLRLSEFAEATIEVTVLSPPERLTVPPERRPEAVQVGRHGLIVRGGGCSGLLLPQVPCECGWNSREFLDHTCLKAGLRPGCWERSDVEVFFFEGQIFCETPAGLNETDTA